MRLFITASYTDRHNTPSLNGFTSHPAAANTHRTFLGVASQDFLSCDSAYMCDRQYTYLMEQGPACTTPTFTKHLISQEES